MIWVPHSRKLSPCVSTRTSELVLNSECYFCLFSEGENLPTEVALVLLHCHVLENVYEIVIIHKNANSHSDKKEKMRYEPRFLAFGLKTINKWDFELSPLEKSWAFGV